MISFLFALLFTFNLYSAGFTGDTLLLTNNGSIHFDTIDLNTVVQSQHNHFQSILALYKQSVEQVVHISFSDETISCHTKQLFWCVNQNDWICAEDLKIGDLLQTINGQPIVVDAIRIITQQTEIYSLTVSPPHHLYVGKYDVLAHNMPWLIGVGIEFALECGAIEFIKATVIFAVGTIALHFAKNKNKKKPRITSSMQPVFNKPPVDPNDDKNKKDKQHPNGIYKGSDVHGKRKNGRKSAGPDDGQKALDNSYEFNKDSGGRVAKEGDEFVILRWTRADEYHGYLVSREELLADQDRYRDVIKTLLENKLMKY